MKFDWHKNGKLNKMTVVNVAVIFLLAIGVAVVWGQASRENAEWVENLRLMQEAQRRAQEEANAKQRAEEVQSQRVAEERGYLQRMNVWGEDKKGEEGEIITSRNLGMNMSMVSFWGTDWAWADILTTAKWTDDQRDGVRGKCL